MRIKVSKDLVHEFEIAHAIHCEIMCLSKTKTEIESRYWDALREKYKGKNMAGVFIDHETNELVLPLEGKDGK